MRVVFVAVWLGILGLTACGGGGASGGNAHIYPPIAVTVSPLLGQSVNQGASLNISANVNNDSSSQGVIWTLSGDGLLVNPGPYSVTYLAPSVVPANDYAVVTATAVASSTASTYLPLTVVPVNTFPNVQPVNVDGGPVAGQVYPNGGFTTVTVCAPGTLNCATIDGILVDTGFSGLRILASALPSLPTLTDSSGNTVNECVQFPDQSYVWGKVEMADLRIAGEVAGALPVQAIADPTGLTIPSDCSTHGAGIDADTQAVLGVNGMLGVGSEPQDCGAACDPSAGGAPPGPAYYTCSGSSCAPAFVALAQQVTNPAVLFGKDNNGAMLQFGPLTGAAATISGSITFGIGTQTNNVLGSATVFTVDANGNFTTSLVNTGQTLNSSFIDSGSSGLFFPDGELQPCPAPESAFFCPASLMPMTAINVGANSAQATVNFSVDNASDLLSGDSTDAAFSDLAGPLGTSNCVAGSVTCSFDWGLPFFYGRTVYNAIRGQTVPVGAPPAPWWAYTTGY